MENSENTPEEIGALVSHSSSIPYQVRYLLRTHEWIQYHQLNTLHTIAGSDLEPEQEVSQASARWCALTFFGCRLIREALAPKIYLRSGPQHRRGARSQSGKVLCTDETGLTLHVGAS